jgi:hypothetical protein
MLSSSRPDRHYEVRSSSLVPLITMGWSKSGVLSFMMDPKHGRNLVDIESRVREHTAAGKVLCN